MSTYTTSWQHLSPELGLQPITTVSTTQNHPLGRIVQAVDKGTNANGVGEFIYLVGVASTVAGSWVLFEADAFLTTLLGADQIGPVAVAMCATVASTYGWYQISGKAVGKALTAYADNGLVYATATAGSVDDAAVSGDRVKNAKGASALDAPATGFAEFEIQRPWMDDGSSA